MWQVGLEEHHRLCVQKSRVLVGVHRRHHRHPLTQHQACVLSHSSIHSLVAAELPDQLRSQVDLHVLLQALGGHRALGEQLGHLRAERPVQRLDGVVEPGVEQLPALLLEEVLEQVWVGGEEDLHVDHFGDKLLRELLHQLDQPADLEESVRTCKTKIKITSAADLMPPCGESRTLSVLSNCEGSIRGISVVNNFTLSFGNSLKTVLFLEFIIDSSISFAGYHDWITVTVTVTVTVMNNIDWVEVYFGCPMIIGCLSYLVE